MSFHLQMFFFDSPKYRMWMAILSCPHLPAKLTAYTRKVAKHSMVVQRCAKAADDSPLFQKLRELSSPTAVRMLGA